MNTHRLKIRIGDAEFEAEGTEETVNQQFEAFKELIQNAPRSVSSVRTASSGPAAMPQTLPELDLESLNRLFFKTKGGKFLSLYVTIQGEDRLQKAILLLLYGYRRLLSSEDLPVTTLKDSLEQSGFIVGRIDRVASPLIREALVVKAGKKGKGGRYRLTNLGFTVAETEAKRLLEQMG